MRKTCKYLPITILPFLFLSGMDAAALTALREFLSARDGIQHM
jgi:hypothetical protein